MAGVFGNKNACGTHANSLGNTYRWVHGRFSREYLQRRADRNQFMRECQRVIDEMDGARKLSKKFFVE